MKLFSKLRELLIYNGLDKEEYKQTRPRIIENNRKLLVLYTSILFLTICTMTIVACFNSSISKNMPLYFATIGACLLIGTLSLTVCKKVPLLTTILVYLFISVVLSYGLVLGTVISKNIATVSYVVLMFAAPLVFTERAHSICLITILSVIVYFILAITFEMDEFMLNINSTTVIPYGLVSLPVCVYVINMKTKTISYQMKIENISLVDQLTGLLNRRSADIEVDRLTNNSSKVLAFVLDVNYLKKTNDKYGHAAGDEIIIAAANIIKEVFGAYGKCFRVGGDEFLVLIENPELDPETLKAKLISVSNEWKGELVPSISLAIGYSITDDTHSVYETAGLADKLMYKNKEKFHLNNEE